MTNPRVGIVDTAGPQTASAIWGEITPEFLDLISWCPQQRVAIFPQGHSLLGFAICTVSNCDQPGKRANRLCGGCNLRWVRQGRPPIEEFRRSDRRLIRLRRIGRCAVRDCERPWQSSRTTLCNTHQGQRNRMKLTVDEFLIRPEVTPLPAFGQCEVIACLRDRNGNSPYCSGHHTRWQKLRGESGESAPDEGYWRQTQSAIAFRNEISLGALPDHVVAELLYALQHRTMEMGAKTDASHFRTLTDRIRMQQIGSVEDYVDQVGTNREVGKLLQSILSALRRRLMTPDTERLKDEWDATVFGHRGIVRFDTISQRWLKEATKIWAFNDLPQRRGDGAKGSCQTEIRHMGLLSESLHLQRPDNGGDLTALSRDDITAFLNRVAFLQSEGTIRARRRTIAVRGVAMMLERMRALGLTRPGQPLHGLPDDFAITNRDIPDLPVNDAAGRDLPAEVMQFLCGQLDKLETIAGREVRVAIELLIDTGRRPDEVCQLSLDCLERDQSGKPVLVYTNYKANREGRRLPIPASAATLIESQQQRVRERFPDTPVGELKLLPTTVMNPHGRKSISDGHTSVQHRMWVDSLPDIFVSGTGMVDETATTAQVPFDKHRIFPYAYRHSFAQRHADAGVPVDVLCDLMDHRKMETTQGYYRVGERRRRGAIERVTSMQFDRRGDRIWRDAKTILDSELLRRAVGEVAVPYGNCSEPSNVAAGGQDCPVRFRCVGCSHFSTDVSYLPDLEAYLADLLRSRERLRSAFTAAEDWARTEAMPSDDEITRIRRLISRIQAEVDELSDDERIQIEQAVGVVRRARTSVVTLGLPQTRQPLPDLRPDRSA